MADQLKLKAVARRKDTQLFRITIGKMSELGFVADTHDVLLEVGEELDVTIQLKEVATEISDRVKVVKTYDRPGGQHIAECHFQAPSSQGQSAIKAYNKLKGQS